MTISHGYATLDEVRAYNRAGDVADDAELELMIEAASRLIDRHCHRQFYADTTATARVYRACHPDLVEVDDISTTTGLIVATDEDANGSYEITWATTDYQLEPLNGLARSRAVWRIRRKTCGNYWFPLSGDPLVQVTAKWGWPAVPPEVKQACIIQASKLSAGRNAPFGIVTVPGFDVTDRMTTALHPDATVLLRSYIRLETPL